MLLDKTNSGAIPATQERKRTTPEENAKMAPAPRPSTTHPASAFHTVSMAHGSGIMRLSCGNLLLDWRWIAGSVGFATGL